MLAGSVSASQGSYLVQQGDVARCQLVTFLHSSTVEIINPIIPIKHNNQ